MQLVPNYFLLPSLPHFTSFLKKVLGSREGSRLSHTSDRECLPEVLCARCSHCRVTFLTVCVRFCVCFWEGVQCDDFLHCQL